MSYDFINTTLTDAKFSGSLGFDPGATAALPTTITTYGQAMKPGFGTLLTAKTHTGLTGIVSGSLPGCTLSSSLGYGNYLYFVNGLLVSSSA